MAEHRPDPVVHDRYLRPFFWRIPLVAILVVGLAVLFRVDRLLVREVASEASTQAVQTDALLESFLKQRVALLNGLRAQIATARSGREAEARFSTLAGELVGDSPDLFALYLLDEHGRVVHVNRRGPEDFEESGRDHAAFAERGRALALARQRRTAASTGSIRLMSGARGMMTYVPVVRDATVIGFVGGALDYQALFSDALAGQLQGRFGYRIEDAAGEVIARSPDFPTNASATVERAVSLPGELDWRLEVAVPPFQPLLARLFTWLVGLALLAAVSLLVLREEARARRLAAHSLDLELLSRDLLDANVRLEERARQIAEANRAKSRFLANVSHELRTPLNAIVGFNSLALDGIYGPLARPLELAHRRIRAAADHLLGLVDDVLDLSKIESGRLEIDAQEVDVGAALDGIGTVLDPIAEAKGVRLDIIVGRDVPRLRTDGRHLRQILLNLTSNAIKFTEQGAVTISARRTPESPETHIDFVVRDTGIGIAERDQERIFEEFEQVAPSARGDSMQRGTGLGLAISRKLARLLGGEIVVESRLGEGSSFMLRLPIEPRSAETSGERALAVIGGLDAVPDDAADVRAAVPRATSSTAPSDAAATTQNAAPSGAPIEESGEDSGEGAAVSPPARRGPGLDASSPPA
jgi:signal transduction histidine kinase